MTARAARDNGALVELLRTYPGSSVNAHVARFVVWGRHSGHLLSPQPWDYAFGHGSALERFVDLDGRILLLGSDPDNVTFLHYAEHIADIPDKRVARFQVPVSENGVRVWREMAEFNTAGDGVHPNWPDLFFARIVDAYLAQTSSSSASVGDASSHLVPARGLLDFALPVMTAVARDPRAVGSLTAAAAARARPDS
jgi:aminoglycoside 3-N-acetyltransferase